MLSTAATPFLADSPESHCSNNCEDFDVGDGDDYVDDVGDKNHHQICGDDHGHWRCGVLVFVIMGAPRPQLLLYRPKPILAIEWPLQFEVLLSEAGCLWCLVEYCRILSPKQS